MDILSDFGDRCHRIWIDVSETLDIGVTDFGHMSQILDTCVTDFGGRSHILDTCIIGFGYRCYRL